MFYEILLSFAKSNNNLLFRSNNGLSLKQWCDLRLKSCSSLIALVWVTVESNSIRFPMKYSFYRPPQFISIYLQTPNFGNLYTRCRLRTSWPQNDYKGVISHANTLAPHDTPIPRYCSYEDLLCLEWVNVNVYTYVMYYCHATLVCAFESQISSLNNAMYMPVLVNLPRGFAKILLNLTECTFPIA